MSERAPAMVAPRRLNKEGSTLSLNALTRASIDEAGAAQRTPRKVCMICVDTALANEPFEGGAPVNLTQPDLLRSCPDKGRSTNARSRASLKDESTICWRQAAP